MSFRLAIPVVILVIVSLSGCEAAQNVADISQYVGTWEFDGEASRPFMRDQYRNDPDAAGRDLDELVDRAARSIVWTPTLRADGTFQLIVAVPGKPTATLGGKWHLTEDRTRAVLDFGKEMMRVGAKLHVLMRRDDGKDYVQMVLRPVN